MNRTLIHLGVAAVVLMAVIVADASFYRAFTSLAASAAALKQQTEAQGASLTQGHVAEAELAQLSSTADAVDNYLIAPDNVVPFLEELQRIGTTTGAVVSVSAVSAAPAPQTHLDLALTIKGPFAAVMRTVGAIEYGPHDIETRSLTLANEQGIWNASLTLTVGTHAPTP